MNEKSPSTRTNFIRDIIDEDLASGKHDKVVTRFPPEPNGYLHIGHAKAICVDFGIAEDYEGQCHLRMDDTNPETEDPEFVESIIHDVEWLGFSWGDHLYYASDYFQQMHDCAVTLIERGKAYVDSSSKEEIEKARGTIYEAGTPTPDRDRPIEESLELFERMKNGELDEGSHVLRAKIDLAAKNMLMRDPVLYRIRKAHHYRQGDDWNIYPLYDFAHCLEDSFEGVTHSLCTLEFENNRELYDWVIKETEVPWVPRQIEFARLALTYTVVSKRILRKLVESGTVSGWDDPRMPTLAAFRRRGVRPEAIRAFCDAIGVAKANSLVDVAQLEATIRDDLNPRVKRVMAVLDPLKVTITNWPAGQTEELDASYYPHDVPLEGSRKVPFSGTLYIERSDFAEKPPPKFFRLTPGGEVRLRYGYFIKCEEVVKDDAGKIIELRCTYDPDTKSGKNPPDGRKVKGTIHWLSADHAHDATVRLYDRLFKVEQPGKDRDIMEDVNPDSLAVCEAKIEPELASAEVGERFQFERQGYFCVDPDSTGEHLVFNRIVTLRDTWAKISAGTTTRRETPENRQIAGEKTIPERSEALKERWASFRDEHGLPDADAEILSRDEDRADFFAAAVEVHDNPKGIANWIINEILREIKDENIVDIPFDGAALGQLVALIDEGTISSKIGKDLFAEMMKSGGSPRRIVEARGLQQLSDPAAIRALVDEVIAQHPEEVAAYKGGNQKLFGFFVGQVMKASKGKANPQVANAQIREALD